MKLIKRQREQLSEKQIGALPQLTKETLEYRWHLVYERLLEIAARYESITEDTDLSGPTILVEGVTNSL